MHDVKAMVELLGGMAQKQQLVRVGARDLDLTRAVRSGEVTRARQGWYTTLDDRSPEVQAVRIGGRLTGLSAIHALGGWVLSPPPLHVSLPPNAARLRSRWNRHRPLIPARSRSVLRHWESPEVASRGTAVSVGLRDALVRVILDEPDEAAIAALDWAIHEKLIEETDLAELAAAVPECRRHVVASVDPNCGSFPESVARTRLLAAGHRVRSQVPLDDGRIIDLLIDERVGLEVDGREFHATTFERDSAKSVAIAIAGWIPLRPSASLVLYEWETVMVAITTLLGGSAPAIEDSAASSAGSAPSTLGNSGLAVGAHRQTRAVAPPQRGRRAATPEFPKERARRAHARAPAPRRASA